MREGDFTVELMWRELREVLDEELGRLAQKYRAPLVLVYLEGKTTQEAARLLGCPKGTVLSRLARGRDRLRGRLVRRGVTLSVWTLVMVLVEKAAPHVEFLRQNQPEACATKYLQAPATSLGES